MNIALVPGLFGFGKVGPIEYFNGVAQYLRNRFPGAHVEATTTDPLGRVADRAKVLAKQIVDRFGAAGDVHLIAHSMGGLDARFLASNNLENLSVCVKTVATVGTPHSGSPVATVLEAVNPLDSLALLLRLDTTFLAELRDKADAVRDLSSQGAAALNSQCPDVQHIRYLEVAGVGRAGTFHTSKLLAPTFLFVHAVAGRNDGLVPVTSAQRQRPLFASWPADHADLIGHDLDGPTAFSSPRFNHFLVYEDIVQRGILGKIAGA
jgi:triacylglycerol lipase